MAYKITEDCINCAACEYVCPTQAISGGKGKAGQPKRVVDPDRCTECKGFFDEPQCEYACAVQAPVPDPDHRESEEKLLAKVSKS